MKLDHDWAARGEEEKAEEEQEPEHVLTTKMMFEGLALFHKAVQFFSDNDPNYDTSLKVARQVEKAITCYNELYWEKMCAKQTTLTSLFPKPKPATLLAADSSPPPPPEDTEEEEAHSTWLTLLLHLLRTQKMHTRQWLTLLLHLLQQSTLLRTEMMMMMMMVR